LTGLTVAAAVASAAVLATRVGWHIGAPVRFCLLALFVLAGELLPIPVPRRHGVDKLTISTAFALAILLTIGVLPACAVCAAVVAIADLSARTAPVKALFNAAQYVLALAGAGAVLIIARAAPPVAVHAATLPAILLGAFACLAINHLLAGSAAALLAGLSVAPYLRDDLAFQAWTAGCIIALTPGVIASADATLALIPFAFVPMLAIFGGREASISAHRTLHDPLTELPNRALLTQSLDGALQTAARARSGVAVMIIDLDDFKAINDTLGPKSGDRVLQLIAPRLAAALASHRILARLGGDEFAAVIEGVRDNPDALRCAQRWLAALQRPFEIDSLLLELGASIGVACYPQHGQTSDELLRHADIALYCAKAQRATCTVYSPDHDQSSIDRLALAAELRDGINRDQLVVHYQPKLPLKHDLPCGVEALVRWNHPQHGRIGPDRFIALAEQTGLIKTLTEHVLKTALHQCQTWRDAGLDVRFSVNLSTRNLIDHDLPATIRALLHRFTVPPASLQLEITESRIVADLDRAQTVLHQLRAIRVTIAIDDFGTGFSSLSQLQQFPIDEIKIDRSFVIGMETNCNNAALVRSIIELARSLGLRVTAEGVETANAHHTLRELGCDFAQGFHIGKPAPADECRRLIHATPHPLPNEPARLVTTSTLTEP